MARRGLIWASLGSRVHLTDCAIPVLHDAQCGPDMACIPGKDILLHLDHTWDTFSKGVWSRSGPCDAIAGPHDAKYGPDVDCVHDPDYLPYLGLMWLRECGPDLARVMP